MQVPRKPRSNEAWEKAWANRGWVHTIINKMKKAPKDDDAAVTAGLDALCAAYDNYDPRKNSVSTFKSYSFISIVRAVYFECYQNHAIRIPNYVRKLATQCVYGHMDIDSIPESCTGRADLKGAVKDAIKIVSVTSLSYLTKRTEPFTYDNNYIPCELLQEALDTLPPRERITIDYLYPLSEDAAIPELTPRQKQDSRHYERKALARMREFLERRGYESN